MERKKKFLGLATLWVAAAILAGCKNKEQQAEKPAEPQRSEAPTQAAPAEPSSSSPSQPAAEARKTSGKADAKTGSAGGDAKLLLTPKKLAEKAPDAYQVKFDTTRGAFTVTVTRAWA